jgi:hypothetical protein
MGRTAGRSMMPKKNLEPCQKIKFGPSAHCQTLQSLNQFHTHKMTKLTLLINLVKLCYLCCPEGENTLNAKVSFLRSRSFLLSVHSQVCKETWPEVSLLGRNKSIHIFQRHFLITQFNLVFSSICLPLLVRSGLPN